jgi:hypothetical protein
MALANGRPTVLFQEGAQYEWLDRSYRQCWHRHCSHMVGMPLLPDTKGYALRIRQSKQ